MEFGEKLQNLRKNKGITQEELAQNLFVSRTAVSKWESGRGYPGIDSIKEIANFFSVSIDELLSSEKILSIAVKENKQNIQKICSLIFGVLDLFTLLLIILPLYPNAVQQNVYSVNLFKFTLTSSFGVAYWVAFLALALVGLLKIMLTQLNIHRCENVVFWVSMVLGALTVLFLILTRQVYSSIILFVLLIIKGVLYLKYVFK
ncbi:MAG: helix-turn-helix transcriptional regulator [Clostridia bacterium]|nr:helix-turn-helix transcriptional regulator [Clostridia bacterium]